MNTLLYLRPFCISFFVALVILGIIVAIGKRIPIKAESLRSMPRSGVFRIGGVAIVFSFICAIFLDKNLIITPQLWGVLIAAIAILFIGLWDDVLELSWEFQLFFQIAIILFIFIMGVRVPYVTNPLGGLLFLNPGNFIFFELIFVIGWMLLMMNSMNWIDGIDGLSGGFAIISLVAIFLLSLKPEVNQPPVAIISMAAIGGLLAFLVYNFYPARIEAGTSGSMFMGFILGVLAIFAGAKIATALLVSAIPIIDAVWVIVSRFRGGNSIFQRDRRHLHHRLIDLGWSHMKICAFFYLITFIIAIVALSTRAIGKATAIVIVFLIVTFVVFYVNKKQVSRNLK